MVSPLGDHTFPLPLFENNITLPPAQNVVELIGVMVGVGNAFTVTVVAAEVPVQLFASVTVTV